MSDFEYTKECIIFDLLNISLYHGWLLDPQEEDVATAIHSLSYNQLVETIIDNKNSVDPELVSSMLWGTTMKCGITKYGHKNLKWGGRQNELEKLI